MMKKPLLTAAAALLLSTTTLSFADDVEDAIEYRQSIFKAIKYHFGPMAGMIRGKIDYDPAAFTMHAERVAELAKMPGDGFIPGSDKGDTEAKASIWDNKGEFDEHLAALAENTSALLDVSKTGDLDQIKPAFGEVGKTCKGCHDEFREE